MTETKEQLLTRAEELGIELPASATKAEIQAAIEYAAAASKEPEPETHDEAPRPSAAPEPEPEPELAKTEPLVLEEKPEAPAQEVVHIYLPGTGSYTTRLAGKVTTLKGVRAGGRPFDAGADRERLLAAGFAVWTPEAATEEAVWKRKMQGGTIQTSDFPAGALKRNR